MHCPIDNATLQMTSREGIEIDYCPQCRGVWLDRGELDKIIERSESIYNGAEPHTSRPVPGQEYFQPSHDTRPDYQSPNHRDPGKHHDDYRDHDQDASYSDGYHRKRRKDSFLGDLFDF